MSQLDRWVDWCLDKSKEGGRKHRGLKKIDPDPKLSKEFVEKAEHNFAAMNYMIEGNFKDWAVIASFYSRYHCLLAILAKFGYESRNQICTFKVIEFLIESGNLKVDPLIVKKIAALEGESEDLISLREEYQYGTKTSIADNKLKELVSETAEFIEQIKIALSDHVETETAVG
ncbi:HEPN domain-containing protein [Candidatus Woesearchaeota archaeon]|nr:HEPN domain-containing protein [Candidatus Woesearchaeota archaeon]